MIAVKNCKHWTGGYLLLLILTAALFVGCGGGTGTATKVVPPPGRPNLTIGANSLNLGSVSVGSSKTSSLALSDLSSSESITVTQISVTGTGFSLIPAPTLPLVLEAGKSFTLTVSFSPKSVGAASGSLSIQSDAANSDSAVSLSGSTPGAAQLAVSPSPMNFGNVLVGDSKALPGTLTASNANVTVSSAAWNGQGYSLSGITFPATVPAGQTVSFTVTFAPQMAGNTPGSVSFVSNASNSPAAETLAGDGTQPATHSVNLSWDPSTSQVMGYNVYRGTQNGGPYPTKLTSTPQPGTSYADGTVQSGLTYFYVSTSVDSSSVESPHSNQATAAIP
jgi:hypothetical protein